MMSERMLANSELCSGYCWSTTSCSPAFARSSRVPLATETSKESFAETIATVLGAGVSFSSIWMVLAK